MAGGKLPKPGMEKFVEWEGNYLILSRQVSMGKTYWTVRKTEWRPDGQGLWKLGYRGNPGKRELSVPEKHQLKIARDTLRMSDVGARIMGGMTKEEAREIISRLTGKTYRGNPDISYSDGRTVRNAVAVIWEDNHNERAGYFRAYWSDSPDGTSGSPVIGYASSGGSHRTIKGVVAEFKRYHPHDPIYRNGRKVG